MGKRIVQQARGKGGPRYSSPSFRFKGAARSGAEGEATIVDIIRCPGHTTPLAKIKYRDGSEGLLIAPENIRVGQHIQIGNEAKIESGNVLPLESIPEGVPIYNIEKNPGDGGKFVRSSGTSARITAKQKGGVKVLLPSKKQKTFCPTCKANVGICAGGGMTDKPLLKAGHKHYLMKKRNKLYPKTSGTAMNAIDHPFGGTKSSHKGKPTIAPRNAPPGRKVGMLRPKRSGRRKR